MTKGKRALKKKVSAETAALIEKTLDELAAAPAPTLGPLFFVDNSGSSSSSAAVSRRSLLDSRLRSKGGWGRSVLGDEYGDQLKEMERRVEVEYNRQHKDKVYTQKGEKRKRAMHEFYVKQKQIVSRKKRRKMMKTETDDNNTVEEDEDEEEKVNGKDDDDEDEEEEIEEDEDEHAIVEDDSMEEEKSVSTHTASTNGKRVTRAKLTSSSSSSSSSTSLSTPTEDELCDLWGSSIAGAKKKPQVSRSLQAKHAAALKRYTKSGQWIDYENQVKAAVSSSPSDVNSESSESTKSEQRADALLDASSSLLMGLHSGMSYHPTTADHSALIRSLGKRMQKEEEEKAVIRTKFLELTKQEQKNAELDSGILEGIDENESSGEDAEEELLPVDQMPKPRHAVENKKLTRTERNRLQRKKDKEQEKKQADFKKKQAADLKNLGFALAEMEDEKERRVAAKNTVASSGAASQQLAKRVGPYPLTLSLPVDTPLKEDLSENMLDMKPSNFLVKDAFERFQERRLIEPRKKNQYRPRYKRKVVTRATHKG